MKVLSIIHDAIFGSDPGTTERCPVDGWAEWEKFQDEFNNRREAARSKHGKVRVVEEERRLLVHSALAFGSGSIPTAQADGPGVGL